MVEGTLLRVGAAANTEEGGQKTTKAAAIAIIKLGTLLLLQFQVSPLSTPKSRHWHLTECANRG